MSPTRNKDNPRSTSEGGPAYRQIYEQFRDAILGGQLQAGARLPPSRRLAAEIGVSRNTVLAAFEQLDAEGYLDRRQGSGIYVAETVVDQTYTAIHAPGIRSAAHIEPQGLSARGRAIAKTTRMPLPSLTGVPAGSTAFQIGLPSLGDFPFDLWTRMYSARLRRSSHELMRYSDPAGYRPLREAIASHIAISRGIRCTADQVVVVSGSQQALEFSARMLLDPGDPAWIEDPCYLGAKAALVSSGAKLIPVPVDEKGIDVAAGIEREPDAKLAFVTPSHQFPLGATMALDRRLAIIDWAAQSGAWVVEDDYDNEFHYQGRSLAALQAIDPHGRVIYVGTFSKVMYPGMRLGYMIAPPELVDGFISAHMSTDMHSHLFDQAVLADFMESGHFARHLRRMRLLYRARQQTLLEEAQHVLGKKMRVEATIHGLHLIGWLPDGTDEHALVREAGRQHLHLWPLSQHCIERHLPPALLLGYAGTHDKHIRQGLQILNQLLR
ncbi:PLP-dependent aminotransferase family protein [Rhodococcus sp. APC 3903]|uniref:MocR-like pyridoxine biosynthesis transcription factor PdxR n=1 Tax=Rhodococcus sp. APC 3903 TaxID=3035193 RepID=UPI0025B3E289|nr:PLP-dependent aminotransferase family protein [Rhodococcus sp. APC 3903]MDN3459881.1 PLP-dependent aminotransferase family protein [Rhodococcus sp. APC 3903]